VTIRRRLPQGGRADWVGVLEAAEPDAVTVRHRSGVARRFARAEIEIAHLIRDRPSRPG
jgi:ribosome maturation factor RimP